MTSPREDFENRIAALANAPVAYASENEGDSVRAEELLKESLQRLHDDPSLFSGDPNGVFTYDDPILALAALYDREGSEILKTVSFAGLRGEEVRNLSLRWIRTAIQAYLAKGDRSFVLLGGRTPSASLQLNKETARIAVVGDAGYKGYAQERVLNLMHRRHEETAFDLVVHLGDTYFSGSAKEIFTNLLAPFSLIGPRVVTLVGNHDLYYGAEGFSAALDVLHQPGRYFSIEGPHFKIVCLDTSLAAESLRRNEGLLDEGQLTWLKNLLKDDRPTILMSHHFVVSAWEKISEELLLQLRELIKPKVKAWYWGHEHGCATYNEGQYGFSGACVGNGAFLEVKKEPKDQTLLDWYAEGNCNCYSKDSSFWPHGFLELEIRPGQISETYHLENDQTYSRTVPFR